MEVLPFGTDMVPGEEDVDFVANPAAERYVTTHHAIGTDLAIAEVIAIAEREGWRALHCNRGPFEVIEVWLENRILVEVLTPDFKGDRDAIQTVIDARPDTFNHNIETVPRLYPAVRPQAKYRRSMEVLRYAKELSPEGLTKSGFMVGLGEVEEEIHQTMQDLRDHEVDILTIGQYLRPSENHLPMSRYYTPKEFATFRKLGFEMGFKHVESGPLVRSSYHAHEQTESYESSRHRANSAPKAARACGGSSAGRT